MGDFEQNNAKFVLGVLGLLILELGFSTSAWLTQLFCLGLCEDHLVLCATLSSTDPLLSSSEQHSQFSDQGQGAEVRILPKQIRSPGSPSIPQSLAGMSCPAPTGSSLM